MAWWQSLFGGARENTEADSANLSRLIDVIPGKLAVQVRSHRLRNGSEESPCWTYITAGLRTFGQKELIFTLRREANEDPARFPEDPLGFFGQICGLAQQGKLVDVGGYTCFRVPDGFLGKRAQIGIAYVAPQPLGNLALPSPAESLAAILLTPEEAEVVPSIGSYRVMALLGQTTRYYPCPPWSDRRRKAVLSRAELAQSLLGKVNSVYVKNASVRTFLPPSAPTPHGRDLKSPSDYVCVRLPREQSLHIQRLLTQFPAAGAVALLTEPDPEANGRLVWTPGQQQPQVIAPPGSDGSCLTGGFVALMYGAGLQDDAQIFEDGFAVSMCPATWERVLHALRSGTALRFDNTTPRKMGFELEWDDARPEQNERPVPTATDNSSGFHVARLFLYQPDEVLKKRVAKIEVLTNHVQQVVEISADYWGRLPASSPQLVTLVIAIKPGRRVRFWAEFNPGGIAQDVIQDWMSRLEAIPSPVVWQGPVAFAIHARLGGASGGEWEMFPREWKFENSAGLLVPDDILKVIWPD